MTAATSFLSPVDDHSMGRESTNIVPSTCRSQDDDDSCVGDDEPQDTCNNFSSKSKNVKTTSKDGFIECNGNDKITDISEQHPVVATTRWETSSNNINNDVNNLFNIYETRNYIFRLSSRVGQLSALFLQHGPSDEAFVSTRSLFNDGSDNASQWHPDIQECMQFLLSELMAMAQSLSIDWKLAILKKVELNRRKYPVGLCKGKAGKYTEYSKITGITKDHGQSTMNFDNDIEASFTRGSLFINGNNDDFLVTVQSLMDLVHEFAVERQWTRYHLPRSLVLAMLGELGELSELFQWHTDTPQVLTPEFLDKVSQEIADVSIYLLRLASVCNVSLK